MTSPTSTQPLPVITVAPAGPDREPPRPSRRVERTALGAGIGIGLGLVAVVLVAVFWQAIVAFLTGALIVSVVGLIVCCLLFRVIAGGRLGSALLGAIAAALVLRRRR